jgi:hypothetical protein
MFQPKEPSSVKGVLAKLLNIIKNKSLNLKISELSYWEKGAE